jgi:hypothetical protein
VNINSGAKVVQTDSKTTAGDQVYTAVSGLGIVNIYKGAEIISDNYGVYPMTSGTPVVNIYGGTITAPIALGAATNGGAGEKTTINVSGGTINGALYNNNNDGVISVSGGIFDAPVAEKYCAEGYIPADNGDGTYGVEQSKFVAQIGNVKYETVAAALAVAKSGETVQMIANTKETDAILIIMDGVTLDLNGYTVEANYVIAPFDGSRITDTTNGAGLLKIAKNCLALKTNYQIPVWVSDDAGFRFVNVTGAGICTKLSADSAWFRFQINRDSKEDLLFKAMQDGGVESGLTVRVKMTWTGADQEKVQYAVFKAEHLKTYANSWDDAKGKPGQEFRLTVTGIEGLDNFKMTAEVVYDTVACAALAVEPK